MPTHRVLSVGGVEPFKGEDLWFIFVLIRGAYQRLEDDLSSTNQHAEKIQN